MGSCFSIQISVDDQALYRIFRCLCGEGDIRSLTKNLKALEREMEDLKAIQHEVQNKVTREEARHQQRLEAVQVWLTRVESIDTRFQNVLSASPVQLQKLCLRGLCSKNVCSSYKYGEKVFLLLEEVKNLKSEGNFEVVTQPAPRSEVVERPTRSTIGQDKMLEKAWNRLMEDGVGIMGLHGMGGVGKTTLFKQIHNKFAKMSSRFGVVIWIVVSQGANISKLQEDIAEKLHLCDEVWKNKNESDKAADIHRVLKGKRFVLMLDDIWEKVDLEAIGVPDPTKQIGHKVAFTTRSREVCGLMGDHEPMQVNCLEPKEAWELFINKVGAYTLRRDPVIVELARKVAEKCRGLPLALSVIGEAMASKTMVQEWEYAVDVLTTSAAEFSDMENKILPIIKYSYDSLVDEHIKSCFLYCALFPEDFLIDKEKLIDYWICEGFIGDYHVIKSARNKGYTILGTLIRANLLMEVRTDLVVMHDVVREMALWIASGFGKQKETFVVRAGVGLHEIPEVKDWRAVRRMSLMKNNIKKITCNSTCSELTTLFLQKNKLKNLSGDFIRSMQKLVVLDLSSNSRIIELPEQISELASLQFLNLSDTGIGQLTVGFRELKKLTHLNLSCNLDFNKLPEDISELTSLQFLDLSDTSIEQLTVGFHELKKLTHLNLSRNLDFNKLPEDISELTSLQFLDLSDTSIEQLPIGFQELKKLSHLYLTSTEKLCSINGISKLLNLRILKLLKSNVHGDVSLVKELQLLEDLQVLTITISTEMGLEQISDDQKLVNCITALEIIDFQQKPVNISLLVSMNNLRELMVESSHVSEIDTYMKCKESKTDSSDLHSPTIPCFTNLSYVRIGYCHGMKDLTWLLFAPNLVHLIIKSSDEVGEIINKEKATNLTGITPFQKLENLVLRNLPKLESIYWSPLPFPFLRHIYAEYCPKLRMLPLNATSVPLVEEFAIEIYPREQGNDLEWEDEDTKIRFLPSINPYGRMG